MSDFIYDVKFNSQSQNYVLIPQVNEKLNENNDSSVDEIFTNKLSNLHHDIEQIIKKLYNLDLNDKEAIVIYNSNNNVIILHNFESYDIELLKSFTKI